MKVAVEKTESKCGHCLAKLKGSSKEIKHMVLWSKVEIVDNTLKIHCLLTAVFIMRIKWKELNPLTGAFVVISINGGKSRM